MAATRWLKKPPIQWPAWVIWLRAKNGVPCVLTSALRRKKQVPGCFSHTHAALFSSIAPK